MDFEKGKQWLSRVIKLDYEISDELETIEELYSCIGIQGISYDKISVVTSPDNKFEKIMAEIDLRKKRVERLNKRKADAILEVEKKISSLEPSAEKRILTSFYIGCKKMPEISKALGYEISYCYQLRKKGIEKL